MLMDYAMIKHSIFAECIVSVVAINSVFSTLIILFQTYFMMEPKRISMCQHKSMPRIG